MSITFEDAVTAMTGGEAAASPSIAGGAKKKRGAKKRGRSGSRSRSRSGSRSPSRSRSRSRGKSRGRGKRARGGETSIAGGARTGKKKKAASKRRRAPAAADRFIVSANATAKLIKSIKLKSKEGKRDVRLVDRVSAGAIGTLHALLKDAVQRMAANAQQACRDVKRRTINEEMVKLAARHTPLIQGTSLMIGDIVSLQCDASTVGHKSEREHGNVSLGGDHGARSALLAGCDLRASANAVKRVARIAKDLVTGVIIRAVQPARLAPKKNGEGGGIMPKPTLKADAIDWFIQQQRLAASVSC